MQKQYVLRKIWEQYRDCPKINLYYWFVKKQIILIHASSVVVQDKCFIFLGNSGLGKTTLARIFYEHFGENTVLNDDLLVLQKKRKELIVYGTPWVGKKTKAEEVLATKLCSRQVVSSKKQDIYIFQLEQSSSNDISINLDQLAKMRVLIQAILGNHVFIRHDQVDLNSTDILHGELIDQAKEAYEKTIEILKEISRDIPVWRLAFINNSSVVDYLLNWAERVSL